LIFGTEGSLKARSNKSSLGSLPEELVAEAMRHRQPVFRFEEGPAPGRALLALPLVNDDGTALGGLALIRPLTEMRRDLRDTRRAIVVSVIALVLGVSLLQFVLGSIYVTRPLTSMAAAMRRLRAGDVNATLATSRRDEVGA